MVQTGTGLWRSHRRSAWNFASATEMPRPIPPEPTPTARHTQADASDEATESRDAATTSEARIRPIPPGNCPKLAPVGLKGRRKRPDGDLSQTPMNGVGYHRLPFSHPSAT